MYSILDAIEYILLSSIMILPFDAVALRENDPSLIVNVVVMVASTLWNAALSSSVNISFVPP